MKVYYPSVETYVTASAPHPPNTQYKISLGIEIWGKQNHEVAKVQMVYDGEVAGRRSPSYPLGTDDFDRVKKALEELLAERCAGKPKSASAAKTGKSKPVPQPAQPVLDGSVRRTGQRSPSPSIKRHQP